MKAPRNKHLTPAMHRVLQALDDDGNCDLVREGQEVWYGLERTNTTVLKKLLRLCLVSADDWGHAETGYERYEINEDGRGVVQDPNYVPRILRLDSRQKETR